MKTCQVQGLGGRAELNSRYGWTLVAKNERMADVRFAGVIMMPITAEPHAVLFTVTMTFPVILSQSCELSWKDGANKETKAWEAAACPRSLLAELQVDPDPDA